MSATEPALTAVPNLLTAQARARAQIPVSVTALATAPNLLTAQAQAQARPASVLIAVPNSQTAQAQVRALPASVFITAYTLTAAIWEQRQAQPRFGAVLPLSEMTKAVN